MQGTGPSPSPGTTSYLAFVQVSPGLEPLLASELGALGFQLHGEAAGGVELRLSAEELFRLCLTSRLAENVRVRLKVFAAKDFATLSRGLGQLPWRAFFAADSPVTLAVKCRSSRLWHSGAVAQRLAEVLRERAGLKPVEGGEDSPQEKDTLPRVFVRLEDDEVSVSVDASGPRLHRRGYRQFVETASLRETLAAAMVHAAVPMDLPADAPAALPAHGPLTLWDPFCGAGTVILEALARARGKLPGEMRRFAMEDWPSLRARDFEPLRVDLCTQAAGAERRLQVIGSDVSAHALESTRGNAERLGYLFEPGSMTSLLHGTKLDLLQGDVVDVAARIPEGAIVLTNPPYGKRLDDSRALDSLVNVLRIRADLRPATALVGGDAKRRLPGQFEVLFQTKNGGLNVALRQLTGRFV